MEIEKTKNSCTLLLKSLKFQGKLLKDINKFRRKIPIFVNSTEQEKAEYISYSKLGSVIETNILNTYQLIDKIVFKKPEV